MSEIMKQPEGSALEKEKIPERGRNVSIRAIFLRHAEKAFSPNTAETGLSITGQKMSDEVGSHLEERYARKGYSSDTERTIETVQRIIEASKTEKKMRSEIRGALGFHYDQNGKFLADALRIKRETCGPDFENLPSEDKKERMERCHVLQMEDYLKYGDQRPDPETYSPLETASQIARRADLYIRMTGYLYDGSEVDLINTTHDYNIGSFLSQMLPEGSLLIEEMPIDFIEGFQIEIATDDSGKRKTMLGLLSRDRDNNLVQSKSYDIDQEKLSELVEVAKALKVKERKHEER